MASLPTNRAVLLDNETCVYCGAAFSVLTSTKEHVIGRNFIPKGELDGHWNLILEACDSCNNRKGALENDISAITMQPDVAGQYAQEDPKLRTEAERKIKTKSHLTGVPVSNSGQRLTIESPPGFPIQANFSLVSPPQLDPTRSFELARLQLMGFFYWLTFNHETKRGGYWPGDFMPVMQASRHDWGNVIHRGFMDAVVSWEQRLLGVTANGYFKIAIRKHPADICWSWGIEWNQRYRLVGFFGNQPTAEIVAAGFPALKSFKIPQSDGHVLSREEKPLPEEEDRLFLDVELEGVPGSSAKM